MTDAQRSDDEGCVTEDFSDSRGSAETKDSVVDDRKCSIIRCQEPSCQATKKFEDILKVWFLYFGDFKHAIILFHSFWKILMMI